MKPLLAPVLLLLITGVAPAQGPGRPLQKASERAEAKASDQSSDSSTSSQTRRVVVVNGKTIVDEETVGGKPVRARKSPAKRPPTPDLDRLLKDLQKDLPPAARGPLRRAAKNGGGSSSSYTRRIVVENGKTVVDEETMDGKPVGGRRRGGNRVNMGATDIDELMRQLQKDMPPEARKMLERARREGANASSQSHQSSMQSGKQSSRSASRDAKSRQKAPDKPLRPVRLKARDPKDGKPSSDAGPRPLRRVYPPKRGGK